MPENLTSYTEIDTTILGTEYRLYRSHQYLLRMVDDVFQDPEFNINNNNNNNNNIDTEINSLVPSFFYQFREDMEIPNDCLRQSLSDHHSKDFANSEKSVSLT